MKTPSAKEMAAELWEALQSVKTKKLDASTANTIAGLVRTNLSVVRLEREMLRDLGMVGSATGNKFVDVTPKKKQIEARAR